MQCGFQRIIQTQFFVTTPLTKTFCQHKLHGMKYFLSLLLLFIFFSSCWSQDYMFEYEPVSQNSGFKMDGYWVWGGSIIKVDSIYHMFASRWPKVKEFPAGYTSNSEIVRATSKSPEGPYLFQELVIGERDSSYWDSNMAHNPTIHKIGKQYVLFYIGSNFIKKEGWPPYHRTIGYATSESINGPWIRSDKPIIVQESNNPAIYVEKNGTIKMMFRSADLRVCMATANSFREPFTVVNHNVWPKCKLEDFFLLKLDGKYRCICEDNVGQVSGQERWGVQLHSDDGISNWQESDPLIVYDHKIKYDDNTTQHMNRRERPQLLITEGVVTHLINGVYDGENSWCQPVKIKNPITIE